MKKNVLLLGRTGVVIADVQRRLARADDRLTGRDGFLPFVDAVLRGLGDYRALDELVER